MTLFEITTGWIGESYERAYVWAESEEYARSLFEAVHSPKRSIAHCEAKLSSSDEGFITELSDCGFGDIIK